MATRGLASVFHPYAAVPGDVERSCNPTGSFTAISAESRNSANDPVADVSALRYLSEMGKWVPATKADVQEQVEHEKRTTPSSVWAERAHMLCEPYATTIFRFGKTEGAFVVGKGPSRVVFFDDIEDIFCTATEIDGRLVDDQAWDNGSLSVALRQAELGL